MHLLFFFFLFHSIKVVKYSCEVLPCLPCILDMYIQHLLHRSPNARDLDSFQLLRDRGDRGQHQLATNWNELESVFYGGEKGSYQITVDEDHDY